jgi:hypothetical protein
MSSSIIKIMFGLNEHKKYSWNVNYEKNLKLIELIEIFNKKNLTSFYLT